MNMKRVFALLLVLSLALPVWAASAAEEAAVYAVVAGGSLRMRAAKDKGAEVVATYKENTSVQILENDGTWCRVEVSDGKTGYMLYEFLRLVAGPGHFGWAYVKNKGNSYVNVRAQANSSSAVAAKCPVDTVVEVLGKSGGWYQVRYDHISGYIATNFVAFLTNQEVEALPEDVRYGKNEYLWDFTAGSDSFGAEAALEGEGSGFSYHIAYPVTDNEGLNAGVRRAAEALMSAYAPSADTDAPGDATVLTVGYDAYVTDDRYYSVVFHGEYVKEETPSGVLSVYVYDAKADAAVAADKILTAPDDALAVLKELYAGMGNAAIAAKTDKADASWLSACVPTGDGLAVYLARGDKIASIYGAQRLLIPYFRIRDSLALELSERLFAKPPRVIDPTRPIVALSFDDGPSEFTLPILRTLEKYDARATFCIVGNRVVEFPKAMKAIAESEHEVATHTWGHADLHKLSQAGIEKTLTRSIKAIEDATGKKVTLLRPPYGHVNAYVKRACKNLGLYIVTWSVDSEDWKSRNEKRIYNEIMNNVTSGDVILCHDLYETTAKAMEKVIPALTERGFQIVTLSELYSFRKGGVEPGKLYTHVNPDNFLIDGE